MRRIVDPYGLLTGEVNRCIRGFMPLAQTMAHHYAVNSSVEYEDLLSAALMSIATAHGSFNPAFVHNAFEWVRTKVRSDLRGLVYADKERRQNMRQAGVSVVSLDADTTEDDTTFADIVADPDMPTPEQNLMDAELNYHVMEAIREGTGLLNKRECKAMQALYLNNPRRNTRKHVAKRLKCSVYVLNKTVSTARKKLRDHYNLDYKTLKELLK